MDIDLEIGDIVVDVATGDVGLLVERYSLFEDLTEYTPSFTLWAWNIFWTGATATAGDIGRNQPYTEEGLIN